MRRSPGLVLLAIAALAALVVGAPGRAYIPSAAKIAEAVADTNRASGRAEPLWFDVVLRIGDEPAASGELASHPTGLARLELRSRKGFVERHLLQGNDYRASRDGRVLAQPHPFLPPVFLLQAASGPALQAALQSFGVASGVSSLSPLGDHDCYVLGGREAPGPDDDPRRSPSIWVDLDTFELLRVDRPDGLRLDFGPTVAFESIRVPSWIELRRPDPNAPVARLEIERVARANAPAAGFGADWLRGPAPGAGRPG